MARLPLVPVIRCHLRHIWLCPDLRLLTRETLLSHALEPLQQPADAAPAGAALVPLSHVPHFLALTQTSKHLLDSHVRGYSLP